MVNNGRSKKKKPRKKRRKKRGGGRRKSFFLSSVWFAEASLKESSWGRGAESRSDMREWVNEFGDAAPAHLVVVLYFV